MQKRMMLIVFSIVVIRSLSYGVFSADVVSELSDLGGERWEFSYDIYNSGTEALEQMTIWFDYSGYDNFEITTDNSGGWSEMIIAADPLTESGAGYDILNTAAPLGSGESLSGFSVAFDYTGGQSAPAAVQDFEIINPVTFETEYSGQTVPEPLSLSLLSLGALALRKRKC